MDRILAGFAGELLKLAAASAVSPETQTPGTSWKPVQSRGTVPSGTPPVSRAPNAIPSVGTQGTRQPQGMTFAPPATPKVRRVAQGVSSSTAPPVAKVKKRRSQGGATDGVPWETVLDTARRRAKTKLTYNVKQEADRIQKEQRRRLQPQNPDSTGDEKMRRFQTAPQENPKGTLPPASVRTEQNPEARARRNLPPLPADTPQATPQAIELKRRVHQEMLRRNRGARKQRWEGDREDYRRSHPDPYAPPGYFMGEDERQTKSRARDAGIIPRAAKKERNQEAIRKAEEAARSKDLLRKSKGLPLAAKPKDTSSSVGLV